MKNNYILTRPSGQTALTVFYQAGFQCYLSKLIYRDLLSKRYIVSEKYNSTGESCFSAICHSYLPIRVVQAGGVIMFTWKNMKICICNTVNKIKINMRFCILFTGSGWLNCATVQPCMWVMLMYEFIQYSMIILPSNILENSYQNFPEQPVI